MTASASYCGRGLARGVGPSPSRVDKTLSMRPNCCGCYGYVPHRARDRTLPRSGGETGIESTHWVFSGIPNNRIAIGERSAYNAVHTVAAIGDGHELDLVRCYVMNSRPTVDLPLWLVSESLRLYPERLSPPTQPLAPAPVGRCSGWRQPGKNRTFPAHAVCRRPAEQARQSTVRWSVGVCTSAPCWRTSHSAPSQSATWRRVA
jgi:hypothetical protein